MGNWSTCTDQCVKTYSVITQASGGGQECPAAHGATVPCDAGEDACPQDIDCVGNWSTCTDQCVKTYSVITQASGGGQECPAAHGATLSCDGGEDDCPCPIGQYRTISGGEGICQPCATGCETCSGPSSTSCLSCRDDWVRHPTNGWVWSQLAGTGTAWNPLGEIRPPRGQCIRRTNLTVLGEYISQPHVDCVGDWYPNSDCTGSFVITTPMSGLGQRCPGSWLNYPTFPEGSITHDGSRCCLDNGIWSESENRCVNDRGCTNPLADNYNSVATIDDGSCVISGCTNPDADNYDSTATDDDGSCVISGCTDASATNYDSTATSDDGTCIHWTQEINRYCSSFDTINNYTTSTEAVAACESDAQCQSIYDQNCDGEGLFYTCRSATGRSSTYGSCLYITPSATGTSSPPTSIFGGGGGFFR